MVKWQNGHFYVFVGADRSGGQATFSMPCLGNATAINLGEASGNLVIPITNGQLTDQFADRNAIHIYRIDSQSRCGLSPPPGSGAPGGAQRPPGRPCAWSVCRGACRYAPAV